MTLDELRNATAAAQRRLTELRARHRPFRGYLVFSSRFGQANLDSSLIEMVSTFPEMFVDTHARRDALDIIRRIRRAEKDCEARREPEEDVAALEAQWKQLEPLLTIDESTQVELRFGPILQDHTNQLTLAERGNLDYALIAELQTDPLVDTRLTPQTSASIRIVFGTLRAFR